VLDWAKRSDTVYTPQKEFGDLTGLNSLPKVRVAITKSMQGSGSNSSVTVVAENKGDSVAFMVHPRLTRGKGGDDVTPIFWSDNYFSLLPGEKKAVTARFDAAALHGASPELLVEGWNVELTAP
jgi:exo-1,4-beta-D-glucosaminidase